MDSVENRENTKSIKPDEISIVQYIEEKYPPLFCFYSKEYKGYGNPIEFLKEFEKKNPIRTSKDLARALIRYSEIGQRNINVRISSTWPYVKSIWGN